MDLATTPESAPTAILLRLYTCAWFALVLVLSREYLVLNHRLSGRTAFGWLHAHGLLLPHQKLTPDPGAGLSYRLGWIGFAVICLTNLYILRKRWELLKDKGGLSAWLDFHIFCGLVGPTFIVFHANFHVGGLVAVSFWSMMISFGSGIVGRYLYTEILRQRQVLARGMAYYEEGFRRLLQLGKAQLDMAQLALLKEEAFSYVGGTDAMTSGTASLPEVIGGTLVGTVRLVFGSAPTPSSLPALRRPLTDYAVARRRLATASYYRRMMGYWHTFHMPFAVFMYVVSVVHIISALVFRVHH